MKVLFVCRANVGRSQMAKELYQRLTNNPADSAGTVIPDNELDQVLSDRPGSVNVVTAMDELGIDVRKNKRHLLTPDDLEKYDEIIVLAEPEAIPDWLQYAKNVTFMEVEDTKGRDLETTRRVRDEINAKLVRHFRTKNP